MEAQEVIDLVNARPILVANVTGSTITGPKLVRITGSEIDGTPDIAAAINTGGPAGSASHVIVADILTDSVGEAFVRTILRGLDTHLAAAGDPVYLGATGGLVLTTAPAAPAFVQKVGFVLVSHATLGQVVIDLSVGGTGGSAAGVAEIHAQVVAGAAINTNIPITGIGTADRLVCVARLNQDATAANITLTDVTSEASITSAGNIQLTTTNTTGDALHVIWAKRS